MTFEYEFTYDEYVETLRASARRRGDWSRLPRLVGIAGSAVALVLLVVRPDGGGATTPVLLMGVSAFTALYPVHWSHVQLKTRWAEDPLLRQPISVTLADGGISWATPTSHSQLTWSAIQGVSETRRLILLHRGPNDFVPVPKRALASADTLSRFRSILSDKVPGRSKGFPVVRRDSEQRG